MNLSTDSLEEILKRAYDYPLDIEFKIYHAYDRAQLHVAVIHKINHFDFLNQNQMIHAVMDRLCESRLTKEEVLKVLDKIQTMTASELLDALLAKIPKIKRQRKERSAEVVKLKLINNE